jgi:predicted ATPase
VDVKLEERAFLVGPNASGKSNFLAALQFLRDVAKPTGGLSAAVSSHGGFRSIRCLHARKPSDVEFAVEVGTKEEPRRWRYALTLNMGPGKRPVTARSERVWHHDAPVLSNEEPDGADPLVYSQTRLEQVSQNQQFRELVEFLASIRYLHVVPQIVRDARRHLSTGDDPHGGDLLRRIKEMPKKTREPRLRRISEALRVAVPQMTALKLVDDVNGQPHLEASFEHWRKNSARQTEEQFSDGTLRFIGFLWSLTERGGPLLLEEPELSLNDKIVEMLPAVMRRAQRLSGRQVIATTHSYAMLAAEGVGLRDVHVISVGGNGSELKTLADDAEASVRVLAGATIAEAVQPLTAPRTAHELPQLDLVGGG